jgi:hypothetical protein
MLEKVKLLMEETGCEQGEAELALELADNDLEKAIKTIGSLLRHIFAVKGKFSFPDKSLYGLILIVVNTKTQEILRLHTVVSYNPALFENSPEMDWYALEKVIFSFRLDEGSLPDFTQELEQKLEPYLREKKEILIKCDTAEITSLLTEFLKLDKSNITILAEELNLTQFRRLPSNDISTNSKSDTSDQETATVWLEVKISEDPGGKEVSKLAEGDMVLSQITDTRDIAHYLAHLIGGRREGDMVPLPAVIKKISVNDSDSEVQVHFAPGIIGVAKVKNDVKINILESKSLPWWKKIIPWI